MMRNMKLAAVASFAVVASSGCATKGYVNRSVNTAAEQERMARIAGDSSSARDIAGVRTDVATLRTNLESLRSDLTALRTEFGARITAMEDQVKFDMPVHFGFDDAMVRDQDHAALERFAKVAQKYYPGAKITVEGFADPAGTPRYNLQLSKRRADAVRDYLVQQGLNDGLLASIGYGESRQVRPGAAKDAPGAELNRRVVFVVEASDVGSVTAMAAQNP
ncbi:OmpA/MotB domain protein [Gemmatirosa kalamazoonensis]|uniref:OmpA/MotB domain protein n=1 Tax=Gemmatirosa kalamazoonensis TaxID=861299 RepID=W0RJU0_9BACT|nr:OmpA family protein [Gemmatirosa kalamazoonensis]AHG91354.1 OmpA/MotB domain protein [Gemmatirosa kalamazoonensis]